MTTINLYQNQEETQRKISSRTANGGFFFSLSILILTILVLIGLKYYNGVLDKQNKDLVNQVTDQNKSLADVNSLQRILDMQARLAQIKTSLAITKDNTVGQLKMTDVLSSLGKDMNSSVLVTKYVYKNGKVSVTLSSGNFNDAARQIFNFKKSTYFSGAVLNKISRTEKSISTEMTMDVKTN